MSSGKQDPRDAERSRWEPILSWAAADPVFRRGLLDEPRGALRATMGIELPPGFTVRFVDRGSEIDVLLPDPGPGEELSEEELDAVAGGADPVWEDPAPPPPPPSETP
jgi:hypothetical protein